jgi:aspartate 1-decarboxylase
VSLNSPQPGLAVVNLSPAVRIQETESWINGASARHIKFGDSVIRKISAKIMVYTQKTLCCAVMGE